MKNGKQFLQDKSLLKKTALKVFLLIILFITVSCGHRDIDLSSIENKPGDQGSDNQAANTPTLTLHEGKYGDISIIGNWYMDTRLFYIMDSVWHKMGTMGEILETASKIRYTSELSWYAEWVKTAENAAQEGEKYFNLKQYASAGEAFMRASRYYLAAEVFLHTNPNSELILQTYETAVNYFMKANKLLGYKVEEIKIPYKTGYIRGYYYSSGKVAPVLIIHQGYDAPIEASKFLAEEAVKKGYNCFLADLPGQGLSIRKYGLPFQYNWEEPVGKVIDYLESRKDVDTNRIGLMGISMGGGFAMRAAAHEKRIKAVILDPGYYNIYKIVSDKLNSTLLNLYEEDPEEFNKKIEEALDYDVGIRWGIKHGMWVFGAQTPEEFVKKLKTFDYYNDIGKIKANTLILDGEDESYGKGQAKELYNLLKSEKTYIFFPSSSGASYHCQTGNPAILVAELFGWLENNL